MSIAWTSTPDARLTVNDAELEYACYGPPPSESATIVLLHEGLGCVALWRDFPQRLAEATGMGVFVYSRAGYGASSGVSLPRPLTYMTDEAEGTLGAVLNAAGLGDVVLMGHSDGATIACIYAGSISDMRVRALVLMAPHFFVEAAGLVAIRAAGEAFISGGLKDKLAPYHADVDATFKGWHDAWTDPCFAAWNVADAIDHLRIPVLAIQGRQDAYGTLAQIEEIATRIYSPLETAIHDDCGHAPHWDQPTKTLDAVAEFCTRLNRLEREQVALG